MQPVHCSPSAFGLLLHRNRSLALLSAAGLPSAAPANPSQRLWPTPAAQPCLRQAGAWGESAGTCSPCSYGLPKATLGILHRLQTLPRGCKPFPAPCPPPRLQTLPSAFGLLLHRSLACVRREPGERASGTCSPCTAAPAPLAYSCLWASRRYAFCSLALLIGSRPAPPQRLQTLPQRLWPTPASQPCLRQPGAPQRLWPTPASQTCLFSSYGLPKATLGTPRAASNPSQRLWRTPASQPCLASASGGSLGREPLERASQPCLRQAPGERASGTSLQPQRLWPTLASQACLFSSFQERRYAFCTAFKPPPRLQTLPSAFGLLLHRSLACASREPGERASGTCSPCTAAPAPLADSCIAGLPLLFLWASKSDVRHFAPPSNPPPRLQTLRSAFKPSAAPLGLLLHRSLALFSAAGLPLLFLWASKSDVRHFGLPSNPPQRLQTLCSAFKPSAAPLAYSCTAALPSSRQQACPPQRSNPPQRETLWNRTLQPWN